MTVEQLIIGSIARFGRSQHLFEQLAKIWLEQSNKISFASITALADVAHMPELPADNIDMPLIAGDIFHNLRCALEYIHRALYIQTIGEAPGYLQLRFSRKDFETSLLKDIVLPLFDRHEWALMTLAAANNQDKHRLLLFAVPKIEPLDLITVDGNLEFVSNTSVDDWHDARQPLSFKLGASHRPRYVLVIEEHKGRAKSHLTLNKVQELIAELHACLESILKSIQTTRKDIGNNN